MAISIGLNQMLYSVRDACGFDGVCVVVQMHCSGLAWNPEVATQLVLASEDDRMPVIQMWDLRFATSPLKVLENHTR